MAYRISTDDILTIQNDVIEQMKLDYSDGTLDTLNTNDPLELLNIFTRKFKHKLHEKECSINRANSFFIGM